jgi:hypothetical protein
MTDLPAAIQQMPDPNRMRVGTVSSYSSGVLVISMAGGEIRNPGVINGIALRAGAVVAMFRQESTWLVVGVIQDPAVTGTFLAPACMIRQASAQNFTSGVTAAIAFDTKMYDTTGTQMWDAGTPAVITAPISGYYDVYGNCSWASNATGGRGLHWTVNGGNQFGGWSFVQAVNGSTTRVPATPHLYPLQAGDQVGLNGLQTSGTSPLATAVGVSLDQPTMTVAFRRPL